MTKDNLFSFLDGFIKKGHLVEFHSHENFIIFKFLDDYYVAFAYDDSKNRKVKAVRGALLSLSEMEVIRKTSDSDSINFLAETEDCSLVFNDKLLAKCNSVFGIIRVKNRLKKFYYCPKNVEKDQYACIQSVSSEICKGVISGSYRHRQINLKQYKKYIKKVRVLGIIALVLISLFLLGIVSIDYREQFDSEKPSVAFDKNNSDKDYYYIEADVFAPFITVNSGVQGTPYYEEFYLYGNSQTKEFGILKFDMYTDRDMILSEDRFSVLSEPVILYGSAYNMKPAVSDYFDKINSTYTPIILPGQEITFPDGTEYTLPDVQLGVSDDIYVEHSVVTDNSNEAAQFFTDNGIDVYGNPGVKYILVSAEAETEQNMINEAIDLLMFLGLFACGLVFLPLLIFGVKTDKARKLAADPLVARYIFNANIPVLISDNDIILRSENIRECCSEHYKHFDIREWCSDNYMHFEAEFVIPINEKNSKIYIYEDETCMREYVLENIQDEDFSGKYFLGNIRIGDKAGIPYVLMDGFISDTPENKGFSFLDTGYRFEVYHPQFGGEKSILANCRLRGTDLIEKALKFPGYTTPSTVRLVGFCPECRKSFCFIGYSVYMAQQDVAYSEDGLDCCAIEEFSIDKDNWSYEKDGKVFNYYNSFSCPHCKTPYIDYKRNKKMKTFGVSGCVHLGRKIYNSSN